MNTRIAILILVAGLLTKSALAQDLGTTLAPQPPAKPGATGTTAATGPTGATGATGQTQVFAPPPAGRPKFNSLAKLGPDGKYIQIDGVVDARALIMNPVVDDSARASMKAAVEDWAADVNPLAIDNQIGR